MGGQDAFGPGSHSGAAVVGVRRSSLPPRLGEARRRRGVGVASGANGGQGEQWFVGRIGSRVSRHCCGLARIIAIQAQGVYFKVASTGETTKTPLSLVLEPECKGTLDRGLSNEA